jgi:hypothetical protein
VSIPRFFRALRDLAWLEIQLSEEKEDADAVMLETAGHHHP